MIMSIGVVRAAAIGALFIGLFGRTLAAQARTTTVIIVRHAEKEALPAADPPLTVAGQARAKALLDAVRDAHVTSVITTQFARTRETAAPAARALGITPEVVPTTSGASHVQDVAAAIRKHAGETVLVVGHSNTVTEIVAALGATKPPAICDSEYDNLYIVTLSPDHNAGVVHGRFGAPTPAEVDAGCVKMR
jgi:broad specificity phosphatase PhoE